MVSLVEAHKVVVCHSATLPLLLLCAAAAAAHYPEYSTSIVLVTIAMIVSQARLVSSEAARATMASQEVRQETISFLDSMLRDETLKDLASRQIKGAVVAALRDETLASEVRDAVQRTLFDPALQQQLRVAVRDGIVETMKDDQLKTMTRHVLRDGLQDPSLHRAAAAGFGASVVSVCEEMVGIRGRRSQNTSPAGSATPPLSPARRRAQSTGGEHPSVP